jgi:hypothetical protein
MNKLLEKIRDYVFKPIQAEGEEFNTGFKTTLPKERASFVQNSMRPGDRKRYFNNYNQDLINRISDIKSTNS